MRKTTSFLIFLFLILGIKPIQAQEFDTTAYKEHYKQRFNSFYYTGNYSTEDKIGGLSKAWAEAKYGFANFDLVPLLDGDSLYHAFIPKVINSSSPVEYYKVLMHFYQHLKDGHSSIFLHQNGKVKRETIYRQKREGFFPALGDFNFEVLEGNIGYLEIPTFNNPEILAFYKKVFPEILKTKALIIDIRKNGGGNGSLGHELIGYLTDQPFYQNINILRRYSAAQRAWGDFPDDLKILNYDWKPYKDFHYDKPVTVLIGATTYSAAEDFLVAFKSIDRGLLIGQTTGGSTGQPLFFELPNEGMGFVCSKRDIMTDGAEFVGKGIQPDVWIEYTYRNFILGKDEAIEKAKELLK